VAEAGLQKVVEGPRLPVGPRQAVRDDLRHVAHQQALAQRALDRGLGQLRDELADGEAVGGAEGVEERDGVELDHGVLGLLGWVCVCVGGG